MSVHIRTVIFYSSDDQKRVAEAYIKQLDELKVFNSSDRTRVTGSRD